jgi:4-amino-4-deoxy-L-arabinose transferase-like glycosyltransferase
MRWALKNISSVARRRAGALLLILATAFVVRGLTTEFIRAHLTDPGWFASGIYAIFDRKAQDFLDGREPLFWIADASRTEAAVYAPGYAVWLSFIYRLTGQRSAYAVQGVQWVMDSLSVLMVVGVGVLAFGWRVGLWSGLLAALSPLLALSGATPLADAPTSWIVVAGAWMLLLAARRESLWWALGAGAMVGASCWLRANALLLSVWWAVALVLLVRASWQRRVMLACAVLAGAALLIGPILVRNAVVFRAFVPTGLGTGTNLWESIGETERAAEFGAPRSDREVIEQERAEMGLPEDAPLRLYWPNGIERDRARSRKALRVIAAHPLWYAGVMMKRMVAVLKYAGEPVAPYGSAGINVTSRKCLPERWQGGVLAFFVNVLGGAQSVLRYLALPLMLAGVWLALRSDKRTTALILTTVLYYLVVGSAMHTELRYGLPMQALLFLFAGLTIARLESMAFKRRKASEELEGEGERRPEVERAGRFQR